MAFYPWHIHEIKWMDKYVLVTKDDTRIKVLKADQFDRWNIVHPHNGKIIEQNISTHTLWRYLNDFEARL